MDLMDQAVVVGLRKYRETYPEGTINPDVEDRAILSVDPEKDRFIINLVYWLRDKTDPFYFFRVSISKTTSEATVLVAEKPSKIIPANLADFDKGSAYIS